MDYYRSSELYHHGILGMKWGVRRFQNKDGTYTNAGKARRNKIQTEEPSNQSNNAGTKTISKLKKEKAIVDSTKQQIDHARQSVQQIKKPRMDLSNMTNQQLQDRITRENLERQYNQMFAPDPKGKEVVDSVLTYGSMALAATSSALAIAISIKQLKEK